MTSTPRRPGLRTRTLRAVALVSAGLLLTGCGAARPGVAAQVGEQRISVSQVDAASTAFCKAYATANPGSVVPMRIARNVLLAGMIEQAIGEQIAQEYDVTPGTTYEQALSAARAQLASFPQEQQAAVLDQQTSTPYRQAVEQAAAKVLLAREGVSAPTDDQLKGRVSLLRAQWTEGHDLAIDPRFAVEIANGDVNGGGDGSLGLAVSGAAKDGAQTDAQALSAYAQSLPASQRCGA